jgi:hypothetical protein
MRAEAGLLRGGVLDGTRAVVASAPGPGAGEAIEQRLAELGGRVARCELDPAAEPPAADEQAGPAVEALARLGGAELLVIDGGSLFAAAGGKEALLASMQACWELTRAVAGEAMLGGEGGLVVLLAPRPGAGEHADAARAGLENLARTLSIEWARFSTRAVALAPGEETSAAELAELVAYLASPAGAYFSGCLLDLRGV